MKRGEDWIARTFACLSGLVCAAFVVWLAGRVWMSPIRGTESFDVGLIVGLGLSLIATAAWLVHVLRNPSGTPPPRWMWTTSLLFVVAVVAAGPHSRVAPTPLPTNAFLVASGCYSVVGFIGIGVVTGVAMTREHLRERRQGGRGAR